MPVILAESAGFCFGVSRAVEMTEQLADSGKTVCTLGPIIHNPQVVERLAKKGVRIVGSPDEAPKDAVLVIRSHGVPRCVEEQARAAGLTVCDATCPFVAKIHRIAAEASRRGAILLIAGDAAHPEVEGIRGHCDGPSYVFADEQALQNLPVFSVEFTKKPVVLVAQTTFNAYIWEKCSEIVKNHYTNAEIFDTICNATAKRQKEAVALSQKCDIMVIVGGRESSNTAKLRDVCAKYCPTVSVETAAQLSESDFAGAVTVGITAGASTPTDIIKEVRKTMSDIIENETPVTEIPENETAASVEAPAAVETTADEAPVAETSAVEETPKAAPAKSFDEMSFEEALEASLQSLSTDEKVRGIVTDIAPNEVQVEVIGRKQTGYIPAEELSADPNANPADLVKIGDELDLLIMRTNDQEGTIMLSKKRIDAKKGWDTIVAAEADGTVLEGTVVDVIKGGILVASHGVRVFVPASHASLNRMEDLSPLLKTTVRFKIIEVDQRRHRAVGSIRQVAKEERKEKEAAFWAQVEVGQHYTGVVKSLTAYGAFVDLGGVDGMIHISELSWSRIKHPSEVVKVGDTVEVYVRDLDAEKHKISLGYRRAEDNPWELFKANYPVGTVTKAKIVGMTAFGAFAQIIPGIDGLIHISQIADHRIEKPQDVLKIGQEVDVKITNVDYDAKRISLSIRALLEDKPEAAEEAAADEASAEE